MLARRLVLVLGAGASMPYGFPSGQHLTTLATGGWIAQFLEQIGYDEKKVDEFQKALKYSGQPSVDAFLEVRPEFMDVGKTAIATLLIPFENPDALFSDDDGRWYPYLWRQIGSSVNSVRNCKLSVVTFNYDRSLEYYLCTAIQHSFGHSEAEAAELLKAIPIMHVYGELGPPHFKSPDGRPYTTDSSKDAVELAAASIRVVGEERELGADFARAWGHLAGAEAICFLGFAYHQSNVERLHIVDRREDSRVVLGSTYGMGDDEIERARLLFEPGIAARLKFGYSPQDALEFLKQHPVFR